jgi:hypothetical protein
MLEQEFKYYLDNQKALVNQYDGKFIVIVGDHVVGAYDNNLDAYQNSVKKFSPGTFLIQRCSAGTSDYSQTFLSRVSF